MLYDCISFFYITRNGNYLVYFQFVHLNSDYSFFIYTFLYPANPIIGINTSFILTFKPQCNKCV